MYAKINGGTIEKFPYTFGDLRRDHPNVSFPKNITQRIMSKYGMVAVLEGPKPTEVGSYQHVQRDALPIRPVVGQYTEENAPDPDLVGTDILAGYWMIHYTAVDMFKDTMELDEDGNAVKITKAEHEAAYQDSLDEKAAENNRAERDRLIAETDWWASSDLTMTAEQTAYRQALRDITTHENWPHLVNEDWPTKP